MEEEDIIAIELANKGRMKRKEDQRIIGGI